MTSECPFANAAPVAIRRTFAPPPRQNGFCPSSRPTWSLHSGARKRTPGRAKRRLWLTGERRFANHRVLNRAVWSSRAAAHVLLGLLIAAFAPDGPVVPGIDDTIERRRGQRIAARASAATRSARRTGTSHKASGLRWLSLMPLVPVPSAEPIWAERVKVPAA